MSICLTTHRNLVAVIEQYEELLNACNALHGEGKGKATAMSSEIVLASGHPALNLKP